MTERDIKIIAVLFIFLVLGILVFILIKPIIMSIIGGLILAYAFSPLYAIFLKHIKSKNASSAITSIIVLIIIALPVYFLTPLLVDQVFEMFRVSQTLNIQDLLQTLFPNASSTFTAQITASSYSIINKISSGILNWLVNLLLDIPTIAFNFIIVAFVFFFALRDSDKLSKFASGLSPLNKVQEKKIVDQFKEITTSIVYGQILVGLVQGITAGIGLFIFGIPNAVVLTILAIAFSIIPVLGPFFVWIPISIYLFSLGNNFITITFILYNLILVSNIDNFLRIYLVSRKTNLSQVIVLIGMVGGLFVFGILGLILGPLILAYLLSFLNAYKDKTLSSLFKQE